MTEASTISLHQQPRSSCPRDSSKGSDVGDRGDSETLTSPLKKPSLHTTTPTSSGDEQSSITNSMNTLPTLSTPVPRRKRASYATEFGSPLPLDTPRQRLLFRSALAINRSTNSSPLLPSRSKQLEYPGTDGSSSPCHPTRPSSYHDDSHRSFAAAREQGQLYESALRRLEEQRQQQTHLLESGQPGRPPRTLLPSTLLDYEESIHPLEMTVSKGGGSKNGAMESVNVYNLDNTEPHPKHGIDVTNLQAESTTAVNGFCTFPYSSSLPLCQQQELLLDKVDDINSSFGMILNEVNQDEYCASDESSGNKSAQSDTVKMSSDHQSCDSLEPPLTSTLSGSGNSSSDNHHSSGSSNVHTPTDSATMEAHSTMMGRKKVTFGKRRRISTPKIIIPDGSPLGHSITVVTTSSSSCSSTSSGTNESQSTHKPSHWRSSASPRRPSLSQPCTAPNTARMHHFSLHQLQSRAMASQLLRHHQEQLHRYYRTPSPKSSSPKTLSPTAATMAMASPRSPVQIGQGSRQPSPRSLRRLEEESTTRRVLPRSLSINSLKSVALSDDEEDCNGVLEGGPPPVPPKDDWYCVEGRVPLKSWNPTLLGSGEPKPKETIPPQAQHEKGYQEEGRRPVPIESSRQQESPFTRTRGYFPEFGIMGVGRGYQADSLSSPKGSDGDPQKWWGGPDNLDEDAPDHARNDSDSGSNNEDFFSKVQWHYICCTSAGRKFAVKHLLTTCLGILIIIAIALTARGRLRHPQMASDEIPSSLEGVVWAVQLIVLRDMNEIRKGFLKTPLEKPSLPEEPSDGSRGHDRVRRYWIDRRGDGDGKKVRVWNNKDGNRLAEEHIPIWNLPVNSRCLQSTCQLKADIDQENDKFFAFMDPEAFEIHLPKNWPSLCKSCIELSRSQFVYRTRVRLWGDLWSCLDNPIASGARDQISFPTGGTARFGRNQPITLVASTTSSSAPVATTDVGVEAMTTTAVGAPPKHRPVLKVHASHTAHGGHHPGRRRTMTAAKTVGHAPMETFHRKNPSSYTHSSLPSHFRHRRAVAASELTHKHASLHAVTHTGPTPTPIHGPRRRQKPPVIQGPSSHPYLDEDDLATLPYLIVDPATFENLTVNESPLSLLRSGRFTAEFRFVLCD